MGYKALVTIDLPGLPDDNPKSRQDFNNFLEKNKWNKIENITTTWKVAFKGGSRKAVISKLKSRLAKAKQISKVARVVYAIQVCEEDVDVGNV